MKFGVRFSFCFALTEFAVNVDNLISTILNQNSINGISKVENIVVLVVVIVNSLCGAARRIHFRSVGKNYNINYNSNTNTNFDFTQLYHTILEHISESEIKASSPSCPQGRCQHLYEHFTASFSFDQDDDEEDYFYDDDIDEGNLFSTDGSVKEEAGAIHFTEGNDHIARLKPVSADDTQLQIRQLNTETEASAISATVPLVNQSDQMISFDSISVESSSDQQESDFESFSSQPNI